MEKSLPSLREVYSFAIPRLKKGTPRLEDFARIINNNLSDWAGRVYNSDFDLPLSPSPGRGLYALSIVLRKMLEDRDYSETISFATRRDSRLTSYLTEMADSKLKKFMDR